MYEIDVLGITQWLLEQQLVNRRTTAEGDASRQSRRVEQITERTTDNEILLYLAKIWPGCLCAPRLYVGTRNQASTSTGSLITSFHFEFPWSGPASAAISGFTAGFKGTGVLAFLANGSSALA